MPIAARLLCVAGLAAFAAAPAHAAEDYDNCTATITSLPAAVGTAGIWCLTSDLVAPAGANYMQIHITANNVTLDCNNFRIDGSLARSSRGILAANVSNLTLRNCRIDGFDIGIEASGDGMLVEDNRFGDMATFAMNIASTGGTIRRNTILDVDAGMYISGSLDVMDNIIEAVTYGIHAQLGVSQGMISGNHILMKFGDGILIYPGSNWLVAANEISRGGPGEGVASSTDGIRCNASPRTAVRDNLVNNFEEAITGTCAKIGNTIQ